MKKYIAPVICAAFAGMMLLSAPAVAQQKTAKVCADEWKANKDANQAAKITEKAYVTKCRADSAAATPAAAPATPAAAATKPAAAEKNTAAAPNAASGKTAKVCADEWKANKDANQAAKITEKAYVAKCRSDSTAAAPAATPASAAPAATAAAPAKPAMAPMAAPAKQTAAPAAAPATGQPAGAKQYAMESQAKATCPSATVVWANLESKIYHFASHKDYGKTKKGAYMCETDAEAQGMRAAKNEKHP